ncbi:hypothetical protein AB0L40_08450 [Patulibacter sp. NPDC049589]|uniref:hypothetical protein n=1 Tax=Patulibacter sp. NPDC049589 TaxID=3154731 RepID=UPI003420C338
MYETSRIHDQYRRLSAREVSISDLLPDPWSEPNDSVELRTSGRAALHLLFDAAPAASELAEALGTVDREARRTAAAIARGVDPLELSGRALMRRSDGFQVQRADPGSLDVVLQASVVIYGAIVSQPLSFVLNLAALTGYGKIVRRAIVSRHERADELILREQEEPVRLEVPPRGRPLRPRREAQLQDPTVEPPEDFERRILVQMGQAGPVVIPIPSALTKMSLTTEYADGSSEEVTFERRPPLD